MAAARLRAQTSAPYQDAGILLARQGKSFGIWSWDAQWVGERLEAFGFDPKIRVIPETFFRHPVDGWRVSRASTGFEAEYWADDFLHADIWRRRPFDEAGWSNFMRVVPAEGDAADQPAVAPPPQTLPYTLGSAYRRTILNEVDLTQAAVAGMTGLVAVLVCATLFLAGQALHTSQRASQLREEVAFRQKNLDGSKRERLQAQIRSLAELKATVERPDPLVLLAAAQQILSPYGFKVRSFNVDHDKIKISLPIEAVVGVDQLAHDLSASPYFTDVHPKLDRAKASLDVEMSVRSMAPAGQGTRRLRPRG